MKRIIFFDGYCNVCDTYIRWVYTNSKGENLFFASQQGRFGKDFFSKNDLSLDVSYIVFWDGKNAFKGGRAILEVLKYMPKFRWLRVLGLCLPYSIINSLYFLVAKNRYKVFGKKDSCSIEGIDLDMFLD